MLFTRPSTLIASVFLLPKVVIPSHRLFDSKILHQESLALDDDRMYRTIIDNAGPSL